MYQCPKDIIYSHVRLTIYQSIKSPSSIMNFLFPPKTRNRNLPQSLSRRRRRRRRLQETRAHALLSRNLASSIKHIAHELPERDRERERERKRDERNPDNKAALSLSLALAHLVVDHPHLLTSLSTSSSSEGPRANTSPSLLNRRTEREKRGRPPRTHSLENCYSNAPPPRMHFFVV